MYRYLVLAVPPGELEMPPPTCKSCLSRCVHPLLPAQNRRPILAARSCHRGTTLGPGCQPSAPPQYRPDGETAVAEAGLQQGVQGLCNPQLSLLSCPGLTRPEPGPAAWPPAPCLHPHSASSQETQPGEARSCALPTTAGLSSARTPWTTARQAPCPSATPRVSSDSCPLSC